MGIGEEIFWGLVLAIVSAGLGVGGKIFYDMLRYKAPPREGTDIVKFPKEYDADLCAFKHNRIDKDLSILTEEDNKLDSCVLHIKNRLHKVEILSAEQQQRLIAGDRRMSALENNLEQIKTDQKEIKAGQTEIKSGIVELKGILGK